MTPTRTPPDLASVYGRKTGSSQFELPDVVADEVAREEAARLAVAEELAARGRGRR